MKLASNGITINCEVSGPEGAPVVALSHSLASSSVMWAAQVPALEQHFRVIQLDTRGHGGSDAPAMAYSLDMLGDDLLAALDGLGVKKFHWVGLSMGGMIGQNLALRAPERIGKLVLCDTSARTTPEAVPVWDERIVQARAEGMSAIAESTLARWFTPPYLEKRPPVVETIRQQIVATPVDGYIGCCEALKTLDYLDQLPGVALPALVVVGEDDLGTDVATARTLHDAISGSRLAILPSAAHLSNVEQADAFNECVLDFLLSE
jgi:3-oxoadipate enol-lactonase